MSKSWIRCSREIRSLTDELNQMKDHPVEVAVHLDDPNEEITEQWQDGLHEWYIRRDDQCSVKPNRIPRDVSEMRSSQSLCPCLKRRSVFVSTNSKKYRRHVNVTCTMPQENLLPCFHRSHQLLPGSNTVSVYLTCLDCRHQAKWTHRTRPTFQQFPELQQMVQAWWTKLQRRQG